MNESREQERASIQAMISKMRFESIGMPMTLRYIRIWHPELLYANFREQVKEKLINTLNNL